MHARVSTAPRYYNNSWRRKQEKRQDEKKKKTEKPLGLIIFLFDFPISKEQLCWKTLPSLSLIRSFSGKSANTASSRFSGFPSRSIDSGILDPEGKYGRIGYVGSCLVAWWMLAWRIKIGKRALLLLTLI
ncbi:hypothetical protein CEXT_59161 [Caerostris extrusa]|uniref:Uncharacterized protein n=1 Tax=Caerostris extrusa TaxID=172846 RepID=A0AAV4U5K5_CAEEX|nr:hypothetical protein CEXT_59161 [Caerostris extrusa]